MRMYLDLSAGWLATLAFPNPAEESRAEIGEVVVRIGHAQSATVPPMNDASDGVLAQAEMRDCSSKI